MATLLLGNRISYLLFAVVVVLQLQCQARNLQARNNYVTVPSISIPNKAVTDLPSPTPSPAPVPTSAPVTSHISSTPASAPSLSLSPSPAPAPDYGLIPQETGNLYNYEMTSQYSSLDNDDKEEFNTDKESRNFNSYKETDEDNFSNSNSNAETNSFTSDDVDNGFWTPNYQGGYKSRSQPQGMSDTRLAGNTNLYNNYYNDNGQLQHDENYSPDQVEPAGYYYSNRQHNSRFEFDSMEEYEKQEGYPDVDVHQDRFFP